MNGLVIERANPAPAIVIDEIHGCFPPRAFAEDTPLQNGCDYVMSIFKNVRFHCEIFANDALYRVTTALDQRLQVLDDNRWKRPGHGRSINQDSEGAKEQML
jgi:hypothetical protein